MFSYECWLNRGILLNTLARIIHKNFPLYCHLPIVLISNETNCCAYSLTTRPTGLILFVKCTNCGWVHLLSRLNERDGLSGGAGTEGAVSHIHPPDVVYGRTRLETWERCLRWWMMIKGTTGSQRGRQGGKEEGKRGKFAATWKLEADPNSSMDPTWKGFFSSMSLHNWQIT